MTNHDDLLREIDGAVADYRKTFPEPYALSPNLELACQAAAVIRGQDKRISNTVKQLVGLPIQVGESAKEPWIKIHLIDMTKAIDVAVGLEDPDTWVSEPCGREYPPGHRIAHSPHWWSEYHEDALFRGGELRTPHYCNGELA